MAGEPLLQHCFSTRDVDVDWYRVRLAGGRRDQVLPLSRAAVAVGAHGLMVEVHHAPEKAMSDGAQSLYPHQFERLCRQVQSMHALFQSTSQGGAGGR